MAAAVTACAGISSQAAAELGQTAHLGGAKSDEAFRVDRGDARVTCKKADIHPKYFKEAKVFCNGQYVMTTSGSQPEYRVEIWSGNHPFYQGSRAPLISDDRVDRFRKKYEGLGSLGQIPTLTKGEIIIEKKKKPAKGKGGKKK
ncbi:hypothetical protein CBR_g52135 [Chara braunii]|uniref:50S ribosomal protein L31 n=1 Tax=Chara braunii TaxID=69332 RepID=A0A388M9W3_CHABU|nr:hypothetical protein CBR_g52135 [Chara braunii]|eukprot:GBG91249.1 hypothetical protein CBR_g52135 [Chara braunii]